MKDSRKLSFKKYENLCLVNYFFFLIILFVNMFHSVRKPLYFSLNSDTHSKSPLRTAYFVTGSSLVMNLTVWLKFEEGRHNSNIVINSLDQQKL